MSGPVQALSQRALRYDAGLGIDDFSQVGVRGLGDPHNSYIQGMAWFKDRLYIGSFRDALCMTKRPGRAVPPPKVEFWPVDCPDPIDPEVWRGEIRVYDPSQDRWDLAYRSPIGTYGASCGPT